MDELTSLDLYKDVVLAESPLLRRERKNRYGSVAGLDDSDLADPNELERQVLRGEFGPVLNLPVAKSKCSMRPNIDQDGDIDWGAFGTIDFERYSGGFDKSRYKADKLNERLKDVLILFGIVNERIKTRAKYLVLKYLRMGIIRLDHIANSDMLALARLYMRAKRIRKQIAELREASERRRQRKAEVFWASLSSSLVPARAEYQ
jgi:hypothetical protein